MSDITAITNELLAIVVADALRPHIGRGKRYSIEEAADAVCVEKRTMRSWLLGETPPQSHKLVRLMRWLGPSFANAPVGLAGLHTLELEASGGCEFELNLNASELCFEMAKAFADDGKVDHLERRRIVAVAKTLLPVLGGYIAEHEAHIRPVAAE